jgi:two-component system, chemotaxis family, chemotaxis protein CheY
MLGMAWLSSACHVVKGCVVSELPQFPDILVLVAEPSVHMRRIIREVLTRSGIRRLLEASDGAEAIEMFATAIPDLVIVDWDMPMLSGEEFIRLARNPHTSPSAKVPILMVLSNPQRHIVEKSISLGVSDLLVKPFSPKALWQRMDSIIKNPVHFTKTGSRYRPTARLQASQASQAALQAASA